MKFKTQILYKIKRLLPMAGLATLTMLPASCGTEEKPVSIEQTKRGNPNTPTDSIAPSDTIAPVDTTIVADPRRDAELFFSLYDHFMNLDSTILNAYINDSTIRNVYLTPMGSWQEKKAIGVHNLRNNMLQPILSSSQKFHGRGNFDFQLGAASAVPDDSVWYVQNGWTINRKPTPADTIKRNIEILFIAENPLSSFTPELLDACDKNTAIDTVYLVPMGHWNTCTRSFISFLRQQIRDTMYPINFDGGTIIVTKIHGRGNFDFAPGVALPEDSLWFVNNGWTINGGGRER